MKVNQHPQASSGGTVVTRRMANGYPVPVSSTSDKNTQEVDGDGDAGSGVRLEFCDTGLMPLEKILYLPDRDMYYRVTPDDDEEKENDEDMEPLTRRLALSSHTHMASSSSSSSSSAGVLMEPMKKTMAMNPTEITQERFLQEIATSNNTGIVINAHRCWCAWQGAYYCPARFPNCRPWQRGFFGGSDQVLCLGEVQDMQLRYVTPVALCVYCGIIIYCFGSHKGKEAYFFLRRLMGCWSQERYRQELANDLQERARQSLRRTRQRRQRHASRRAERETVQATLKTRILKNTSSSGKGNNSATECVICLADFQPNDRVGNLPCGHLFHVEPCLKEWLRRKNHCPLCHASDLAQPVSAITTETATASANESVELESG